MILLNNTAKLDIHIEEDSISKDKKIIFTSISDKDTSKDEINISSNIDFIDLKNILNGIKKGRDNEFTSKEIDDNIKYEEFQIQKDIKRQESTTIILILLFIFSFLYSIYSLYSKRKIETTLANNGINPYENKTINSAVDKISMINLNNGLNSFVIIAISFGISYLLDRIVSLIFDIDLFLGSFALLLGLGFGYRYIQNKNSNIKE